jgi:hypothetical protein
MSITGCSVKIGFTSMLRTPQAVKFLMKNVCVKKLKVAYVKKHSC